MNVSVVIPNLNGIKYLSQCIDSLLGQTLSARIIVVDNASTDDSSKVLAAYKDKITVLKQAKNLGFAGGVNKGIEYAIKDNVDYVALFNNDAIADKNWLKNLVKVAKSNNKIGIVTCKFLHIDKKTIDSTGDFYTIYGLPYPRGRNEIDTGQYDNDKDVFGGSGGASLYKVSMLKDIGLFDKDFFAYYEDVDLSFRAQLAGWKVKYSPEAIVYHHVGATSSKMGDFAVYQTAKNIPLLYLKNMPGRLCLKYLPFAVFWYFRIFATKLVKGGFLAFFKGFMVALFYLPKKALERHTIQQRRSVSIKYIDDMLYHHRPPKPPKL